MSYELEFDMAAVAKLVESTAEAAFATAAIAAEAEKIWRSYGPPIRTGKYNDSIQHESRISADRIVVERVGSDDEKARYIEYGTVHNPRFAPMAKTVSELKHRGMHVGVREPDIHLDTEA